MYYLALDGKPAGPFGLDQLRDGWKQRTLPDDTLFWQEGMTEWLPLDTIRDLLNDRIASAPKPMLLAGFWVRPAALAVDFLVLGTVGFISSIVLFSFYTALGAFGPFLGFAIAAGYFGVQDSWICEGQTLGKRLLQIRVENNRGGFIAPGRAAVRALVFWLPCAWAGFLQLDIVTDPRAVAILYGPLFAWLGAQAYLYIFNRGTRQMLHDLAAETFVVHARSPRPPIAPEISRRHFVATASVAAVLLVAALLSLIFIPAPTLPHRQAAKGLATALPEIKSITVDESTTPPLVVGGHADRLGIINVRLWSRPRTSLENEAAKIAAATLKAAPGLAKDDRLNIAVYYGYNVGISSGMIPFSDTHAPADWPKPATP